MTAKPGGSDAKPLRPDLDKRKAFILSTVVYEYVATAEPVGSNTLTQKYNLGVSSATIRNEMAELEAGGYLVQPHTSAGRIPSDAGYRTYVDQLMEPEPLPTEDLRRIADEFRAAGRELDGVIEQTTRLLGSLSRSVALAVAPRRESHAFRHLQLIWLSERSGLAIVVSSAGVAAQAPFEHRTDVELDDLNRLSNRLNAAFAGKAMRDIAPGDIDREVREAGFASDLAAAVAGAFASAGRTDDSPPIASSGAQHLLDQPEFQDLRKLRSILRIIEEQKTLYELVADSINDTGPAVRIGHELGIDEITECSLVTMPYRTGDGMVGMLAILGPRRMPYSRLLALADGTAQTLNRYLADADIR
jgi:heat-inducible transcriptional repressor